MKKFLVFLLSLTISLTPTVLFAGAAEDRTQSIIDKAISTKSYSSATGHDFTVGGVKAANGQVSADISQRVVVDGSSATVKQKVTIPANDAFYKNTGKYAKNILKGGLYGAAAALAMKKLLDGVDYVMGEGGQIQKTPSDSEIAVDDPSRQYYYLYIYSSKKYSSVQEVCNIGKARWPTTNVTCRLEVDKIEAYVGNTNGGLGNVGSRVSNPKYDGSSPPLVSVPDAQIDDAFSSWFKNNPKSVTDPVTTYIYSPKTSTGAAATTPQNNPSFGQQEITDEMMNNYLTNRNQELYANDVAANQAAIKDSAQTETESNPDGSSTSTKTNPDGSSTKTDTQIKTNPDGSITKTTTEITTKPDGSTSTKTETTTETKPNPETSKLPAACEYLAFLCEWTNWTKETDNTPSDNNVNTEIPTPFDNSVFTKDRFSVSRQCPAPVQHNISLSGVSVNFSFDMTPLCTILEMARPALVACSYLYAAYIVIGAARNG